VRKAEPVDGHVGGGVVAENDHQPEHVTESERDRRREFAEYAGAFDLVGLGERDPFVESSVTGADLLGRVEQNTHLDDRGSLHGLVGEQRSGLPGSQIVSVKRDLAVMSGSNRFDLHTELGVLLGGNRKYREQSKNSTGDGNSAPEMIHAVQTNASSALNVAPYPRGAEVENRESPPVSSRAPQASGPEQGRETTKPPPVSS
jgi:hypothetical protein